jgi:predicted SAM-dependent methyltransferase
MAERILDVGCDGAKTPGAVGVDVVPGPQVDVVWDLDQRPWPFAEGEFDGVVCRHVLEHLTDVVATMGEIHRVCRDGAEVLIEVPHFSNAAAYGDPTHKHWFSSQIMDRFCEDRPGYDFRAVAQFELVRRSLSFLGVGNYIIRPWANLNLRWFERHLTYIFPGRNLTFVLRVTKAEGRPPS